MIRKQDYCLPTPSFPSPPKHFPVVHLTAPCSPRGHRWGDAHTWLLAQQGHEGHSSLPCGERFIRLHVGGQQVWEWGAPPTGDWEAQGRSRAK